jgi:hypothetical protein
MKIYFYQIVLSLSVYVASCSESSNPVKGTTAPIGPHPVSTCSIQGLDLYFEDACSYNFVVSFLSTFDSVTINSILLGYNFYIYADSGDYNYWSDYFKEDSTIKYLYKIYTTSDSLLMKIIFTGQKTFEEEKVKFENIHNLKIISTKLQPNVVSISVPKGLESEWAEKFRKYPFITQVYIVSVCID